MNAHTSFVTLTLSLLLCTAALGCSESNSTTFDRSAMLQATVDSVIIATYADFETRSQALEQASQDFCTAPSQNTLDTLQEAWSTARQSWKQGDAFATGPYRENPYRVGPLIDFWPARSDAIDEFIDSSNTIMPIDIWGTVLRGLPVIEYLIFDPNAGDDAILAGFNDAGAGARRCEYLNALTGDVYTQAQVLRRAWANDGDNYRGEFIDADNTSETFDSLHAAISELFNRMVFAVENIQELKLGKPMGKRSGGKPQFDSMESRFSQRSIEDMRDTLDGVEAMYLGAQTSAERTSFQDYLKSRNASLDSRVIEHIDAARNALQALPEPLDEAIRQSLLLVESAYEALATLHRTLAVDVAGALAITITFNDTDGD